MAYQTVVACLFLVLACANAGLIFGGLGSLGRGETTPAPAAVNAGTNAGQSGFFGGILNKTSGIIGIGKGDATTVPTGDEIVGTQSGFFGGLFNKTTGIIGNVKDEVNRLTNETTNMINSATEEAKNFMSSLERNSLCQCSGLQCACCAQASLLKIQNKLCVNLSVVPQEMAIKLSTTFNDKTLVSRQVSGKNPPPICAPLGPLPVITLCLRPYELSIGLNSFRACLQLEASALGKTVATASFNCFRITATGQLSMETANDNPEKGYVNFNVSKISPFLPAVMQQPINLPYPISFLG